MAEDNVKVTVGAAIDGLLSGMSEAAASVQSSTLRMSESLGGLGSAIERIKVPFLALAGVMAGGAIFKETVTGVVELGVELGHLSEKLGMTTEEVSRLTNAASFSDVGIDAFATGMKKLSVSINEAQAGTAQSAYAFQAMGISVVDSAGKTKSLEKILLEIADKFTHYADGANKSALAVALFGRAGADMIPFLNRGSAGIAELEQKSDMLGATMGGKATEAAQKYHDQMKELDFAIAGLKNAMAFLLPVLTETIKFFEGLAIAAQHPIAFIKSLTGDYTALTLAITGADKAKHDSDFVANAGLNPPKKDAPSFGAFQVAAEAQKKLQAALTEFSNTENKKGEKFLESTLDDSIKATNAAADKKKKTDEEYAKWQYDNANKTAKAMAALDAAAEKKREEEIRRYQEMVTVSFERMGSLFRTAFNGWIEGTEKVGQAFRKLGQSILTSMVAGIEKAFEVWLATELTKKTMGAATAKVSVLHQAYTAAASAYASTAAIPVVGPFLAPAIAAGAFAAVAAFGSGISSAAGGFDIPAGVNPMTQLHAREMVLPATLADGLRGLIAGGGGRGGDVHIHAMDAASFRDFADQHQDTFHDAVQSAAYSRRGR